MALFNSFDDHISRDDWNGEIIFAFGDTHVDTRIPQKFIYQIKNSKHVKHEKLCAAIPKDMWKSGIFFVSKKTHNDDSLQNLQMHILSTLYKNYYFNSTTPNIVPHHLRFIMGNLKDPTRSIHQFKNFPWILKYPIADKLCTQAISLPSIIVMPGPSVKSITNSLRKISKRNVTICISRSLKICLEAGVEPDFVVQYDTYAEQQHFYEDIPKLNNTVLVTLSSANISAYASKFKGIFFRASFNQSFLKNPFILRDSTEGSLLACMGLTEILQSPKVYIAGCDLSWQTDNNRYYTSSISTNSHTDTDTTNRITFENSKFTLRRRDGKKANSSFGYIATAARAEEFAEKINKNFTQHYFIFSEETILSKTYFKLIDLNDAILSKKICRSFFSKITDNALNSKEDIDYIKLAEYLQKCREILELQNKSFPLIDDNDKNTKQIISILSNIRTILKPFGNTETACYNLFAAWLKALKTASKYTLAHIIANKNTSIPILCLASEHQKIKNSINCIFSPNHLEFYNIVNTIQGESCGEHNTITDMNLAEWIKKQKISFISQKVLKKYDYFFDLIDSDNFIVIPDHIY